MNKKYKFGESYKFNDLAKDSFVLIDNCSLQTSTHGYDYSKRCNEFDAQCKADSADFFIKKLGQNKGNFFITQCVVEEYLNGKDFSLDKRKKLINCFENVNSILDYRSHSSYSILKGMYGDLVKGRDLHNTDCDLIFSSLLLSASKNNRKVCVLSNDIELLSVLQIMFWDKVMKFHKINGFIRKDFNEFERFKYK